MNRKTVSGIMLTLLLVGTLLLAFKIQPVRAIGTIYIRPDGSIDPSDAPISSIDNITYTFDDSIFDEIVVERSNITIDGDGYTLEGWGYSGFFLSGINNVTIENTNIKSFYYGVYLNSTSQNVISGNNITDNFWGFRLGDSSNYNSIHGNDLTANDNVGISLEFSSNNNISANRITDGNYGIALFYSSNNSVSGNDITKTNYGAGILLGDSSNYNSISRNNIIANNGHGIMLLRHSWNNSISGNNITANNYHGILLAESSNYNSISGNNITNNTYGVWLYESSNNRFWHNNFIDNTEQVYADTELANVWDDGYPSGGNYWSDYEETYPDAEEIDDSGIWNVPYWIDENNQDNYPLMEPWAPTPPIPTTIDELKTEVEKLGSEGEIDNQGIVTSLIAKLNVAQKLVEDGKIDQAKNTLNAFINEVQAQSGKHITPDAADILIESAEYILSHL